MANKIGEFNLETNEIVLRNMTAEELAKFNADLEAESIRLAQVEADKLAEEAKKNAAQAKLEALGLSFDDLVALGILPKPIIIEDKEINDNNVS